MNFLRDLRISARRLAKNLSITSIILIAMVLGIGANVVVFSVLNAVLLRPMPFGEPERLVMLWQLDLNDKNVDRASVSYPNFQDWREYNSVFEEMAAFSYKTYNLTGDLEPERAPGSAVSASLFSLLRVKPILGRGFYPEEDQPAGDRVVVISNGLWGRRYGSDPDIINRQIIVDGKSATVVGVMPPNFQFPYRSDIWSPVGQHRTDIRNNRNNGYLGVIARLKPNVALNAARSDLDNIAGQIDQQYYSNSAAHWGVTSVPFMDVAVGDIRPALQILQAAVFFVLLIACANCTMILLARVGSRRKEIAVMMALGGGRRQIVQLLLAETLILTFLGGVITLFVCRGANKLLLAINPGLPRLGELGIDIRVLIFALLVTVFTGALSALAPVVQALKVDLSESLKQGSRSVGSDSFGNRLRRGLVTAELALTFVLLIGAGLMIKSFLKLQNVDPGFDSHNVLSMQVSLSSSAYPDQNQRINFFRQTIERIQALPHIQTAAIVSDLPFTASSVSRSISKLSGESISSDYRIASSGYFRAMSMPILEGREFSESDSEKSQKVVILNERLATRFFRNVEPVGKLIKMGSESEPYLIIGVVGNVRHTALDAEPKPTIYAPYPQSTIQTAAFVIRSDIEPAGLITAVRLAILEIDKNQPVSDVQTMQRRLETSIAYPRLYSVSLGILAFVALILAISGIYGVVSYSVNQRTPEIGIRMALGAQRRDIYKLIVGQSMIQSVIGIVLGLGMALVLMQIVRSYFYGVSATDLATYVGISSLLLFISLLACYIPARRAMKIDPMTALRYE